MIRILLHLLHDVAHPRQNWRLGIIVNVALQKLEHIQTITRILHECRKQNIQPVINGDEVVPVFVPRRSVDS